VGEGNPLLPSPTPMAGPQAPHQLNPALIAGHIALCRTGPHTMNYAYRALQQHWRISEWYSSRGIDASARRLSDGVLLGIHDPVCALISSTMLRAASSSSSSSRRLHGGDRLRGRTIAGAMPPSRPHMNFVVAVVGLYSQKVQ